MLVNGFTVVFSVLVETGCLAQSISKHAELVCGGGIKIKALA